MRLANTTIEFEDWVEAKEAIDDYIEKGYKVSWNKKRRDDKTVYRVSAVERATPVREEKAEKKQKTLIEELEESQEEEERKLIRERGKRQAREEVGPGWKEETAEALAKYSKEARDVTAQKAIAKEFPEYAEKLKEEKARKRKAQRKAKVSKKKRFVKERDVELKRGAKKVAKKGMKRLGGQVLRRPSEFSIVGRRKGALYVEETKKPRIASEIDTSMMRWP